VSCASQSVEKVKEYYKGYLIRELELNYFELLSKEAALIHISNVLSPLALDSKLFDLVEKAHFDDNMFQDGQRMVINIKIPDLDFRMNERVFN